MRHRRLRLADRLDEITYADLARGRGRDEAEETEPRRITERGERGRVPDRFRSR